MAQEEEAEESFEQLEMLKRTHDKIRTKAEELERINDRLYGELELVKKTLMVNTSAGGRGTWRRETLTHYGSKLRAVDVGIVALKLLLRGKGWVTTELKYSAANK